MILNAYWQPLDFELPRLDSAGENPWRRWIDTALDSPDDISEWAKAEPLHGYNYRAESRSVVMLYGYLIDPNSKSTPQPFAVKVVEMECPYPNKHLIKKPRWLHGGSFRDQIDRAHGQAHRAEQRRPERSHFPF